MKPLLSLVMIVKNESKSIREVLEAVKPYVDRYTIVDTGSDDATCEIVEEVMADRPGQLIHDEFLSVSKTRGWAGYGDIIDYAATRNLSLLQDREGETAEFQLILSGDEFLVEGSALRDQLEEWRDKVDDRTGRRVDCFFLNVSVDVDDAMAPQARIVRTGSAWRYEDPVHENLTNREDPNAPVRALDRVLIEHRVSDPRARLETIWNQHVPVLKRWLEEEPQNPRALVFLAQSYQKWLPVLEPHERIHYGMETLGLYMRRLEQKTGLEIERHYCMLGFLNVASDLGVFTPRELYDRYEGLYQADSSRANVALLTAEAAKKVKPLPELYRLYKRAADVAATAQANDSMPVSTAVGWQAHYMAAVIAKQLALKLPEAILEIDDRNRSTTWETRFREHLALGLGAGGKWEVFKKLQEAPKKNVQPEQMTS